MNAFLAPASPQPGAEFGKVKSDYLLMLLQCAFGLAVMFLPSMIERNWRIEIPGGMYVAYVVFLYAAIYLGEIRSFYYRVPNWDTILHGFSGLMLGSLGFAMVSLLNDSERVSIRLSPLFVSLFAFSFAVSLGVLWEVLEFSIDGVFGVNMQKFAEEGGARLSGRAALADTMGDLIVDSLGALLTSAAGFFSLKHRKGWVERLELRRSPRKAAWASRRCEGTAAPGGSKPGAGEPGERRATKKGPRPQSATNRKEQT